MPPLDASPRFLPKQPPSPGTAFRLPQAQPPADRLPETRLLPDVPKMGVLPDLFADSAGLRFPLPDQCPSPPTTVSWGRTPDAPAATRLRCLPGKEGAR